MVDIPPSRRPDAIKKAALLILGAESANPVHNTKFDKASRAAEAAFAALPEDVQRVLDNLSVEQSRGRAERGCDECARRKAAWWR